MNVDTLLERLRDESPDGPLARLADLAADELLDTPLGDLVEPGTTAGAWAAIVRAHLESPDAHRAIEERIEAHLADLEARATTLGAFLPEELCRALGELADRPFAPDRDLVVAWLDREPVRHLLRKLLQEALVAFGKRMSTPVADSRLTRGLGDLGRLARETALGRTGAFGALATDLASAVSGEVERQIERRAAEFADAAISGLLHRIAHLLADPDLADEQADLRQALLEGFFELSTPQLASEARRYDPAAIGALARTWLGRWLERESAEMELADLIATFLGADAEKPLGDLLAELGVEEIGRDAIAEFFEARLRPFVRSEGFAGWLADLVK
ncbi:hypothetical protein [Vulgatibacter sp.]|uniref:hypothetical protein n=1 Tax=Vulgatibacter sp. TaxID=1971226 RepID=UPI003564D69E